MKVHLGISKMSVRLHLQMVNFHKQYVTNQRYFQTGKKVKQSHYRPWSILKSCIFTNTEQKHMMLLPFERGMFAVSYSDHNVQIAVRTRVEPSQNCYIVQFPGHTNYARSVRQPLPSNTGLRFREIAVATIGAFQIIHSLCVIDTNFTNLRRFLLKLWRNEILQQFIPILYIL
jgi:hypothetical protein